MRVVDQCLSYGEYGFWAGEVMCCRVPSGIWSRSLSVRRTLQKQRRPLHFDHHGAVLLPVDVSESHQTAVRLGAALPFLQHLGPNADRVAVKDPVQEASDD